MSGKILPAKPRQNCQKLQRIWQQDTEHKSWIGTFPADSRKAYCKICNNTIIAKHFERKRHVGSKKHSVKAKEPFACSQMQIKQIFELQRPDLESFKAEAMLSLFIAEHFSVNTCEHLEEIVKNFCDTKKEVSSSYVAQNVNEKKIVGHNVWWPRPTFSTLVH